MAPLNTIRTLLEMKSSKKLSALHQLSRDVRQIFGEAHFAEAYLV